MPKRLLPNAWIQVDPADFEPIYIDKMAAGMTLAAGEQDEQAANGAACVPLPFIECDWSDPPGPSQSFEISGRDSVQVPLIQELTPIVWRRRKCVTKVNLEDHIGDLRSRARAGQGLC